MKQIEEEVNNLVGETSEYHDWTVNDRKLTAEALQRIRLATLEELRQRLPEEHKEDRCMCENYTDEGYNIYRLKVLKIIDEMV